MRPKRKACLKLLIVLTVCVVILLNIGDFMSNKLSNDYNIPRRSTNTDVAFYDTTNRASRTALQNVTEMTVYAKELSFDNFSYPLDVDMVKLIQDYMRTGQVHQRAINSFSLRFLHNPVNRCFLSTGKNNSHTGDIFLLFVVKSKSEHFDQRNAIRETWGNEHFLKTFSIKTVFVLGKPVNESLKPIWSEIKQFNDIILMDFHDTYFNNSLKTSTAFNWIPDFCPQAKFVVLVDDDIYVSLKTLVSYLDHLPLSKRVQLYMGQAYVGYKPHRNVTSKWYVPITEYPWDAYPSFISAGTVIMTMDFVMDVRIAMRYTKRFRLDDVYLAILAYKLGVVPVDNKNVYGYRVMFGSSNYANLLTSHGFTPKQLKLLWNALH